ncbi:MAG TPA: aminotransferase class V-fold PLP-dependent enzyme [Acidimicrobiales bacterium]|nr:aminotransferase class V-fold PLP-dependent enzyme [Acidimicrobiales bacterium]
MSRHYLDHASTSPARPEVVEAMLAWLSGPGGADPGRVHTEGRMARAAIEEAREQVAALLGARSREVVFTSGATEAVNAAVWGATQARAGAAVVCAAIEHSSVRDASRRHAAVVEPAVDGRGRVQVAAVTELDPAQVALVHCQWGNHEVGTIQPAADVVAWGRENGVLTHVDAAAAAGHVAVDYAGLGADLLSVSAHKLGGPKGAGALVVRRGLRLAPFVVGGEQERSRRGGMENVPAIVGFGAAAAALTAGGGARLRQEAAAARAQTERLLKAATAIDGVRAYGDTDDRLPHIVCVGVDGVEAEAVLLGLDQAGIAAHSGSACSSESLEPSPVLEAMGVDADRSLRLSVGWSTTEDDVDACVAALFPVVERLRALAG